MITAAIHKVVAGVDLSRDEMTAVIGQIMDGGATPAQIGGLLVALRIKGEAVDEIVGAATAMRARAAALTCPRPEASIDTCGTGGDGACTINVSTLAAILLAACGGAVAKHGNRAQSSRCGSADVLEALGVAIDGEPAQVRRAIDVAGIGFAFAPRFHAATRHAAGPRKELGMRTIFNLLGPLTNPAAVRHQVVGVFEARWCAPVAAALGALGVRRAAVVHGEGGPSGIDELTVRGATHVAIYDQGELFEQTLTPASFGVAELDPDGLAGGDPAHNASVMRAVLAGQHTGPGERYEAALTASAMTAALGLALLEPGPLALARLPEQLARARASTRDGAARLTLHKWRLASMAADDADLSALAALTPGDVPLEEAA
ncbi:MAG TPA: anthranilate phosphoribosyltransferase [Kofleriaceae bacterium]